jgi:hypothetical protein
LGPSGQTCIDIEDAGEVSVLLGLTVEVGAAWNGGAKQRPELGFRTRVEKNGGEIER